MNRSCNKMDFKQNQTEISWQSTINRPCWGPHFDMCSSVFSSVIQITV